MAETLAYRDHTENPNRLATADELAIAHASFAELAALLAEEDLASTEFVFGGEEVKGFYSFRTTKKQWVGDLDGDFPYTEAEFVFIGPDESIPGNDTTLSRKLIWSVVLGEEAANFDRTYEVSDTYELFDGDRKIPDVEWDEISFVEGFFPAIAEKDATLDHLKLISVGLELLKQAEH